MATAPPPPQPDPRQVARRPRLDVSIQTSSLIREEIELAKAEVREKVNELVKGSVVGIAAGTFAFLALILIMHGFAWLINDLFFDETSGPGSSSRAPLPGRRRDRGPDRQEGIPKGAPPTPDLAIEEAKRTRAALTEDGRWGFSGDNLPTCRDPGPPSAPPAPAPSPAPRSRSARTSSASASSSAPRRRPPPPRQRADRLARQVAEHRGQLIAGAAVVGFVVGARFMLERRRNR